VTDTQTDTASGPHDGIGRAYRAAKMVWLRDGEIKFEDMFSCFARTIGLARVSDRRISCDSIVRAMDLNLNLKSSIIKKIITIR